MGAPKQAVRLPPHPFQTIVALLLVMTKRVRNVPGIDSELRMSAVIRLEVGLSDRATVELNFM